MPLGGFGPARFAASRRPHGSAGASQSRDSEGRFRCQVKRNDFKYQAAGEGKVGDRPALARKITAPDGKDFTLFFDKQTGLPVKEVAQLEIPGGREATAETTFSDYKDFGGIKKATKIEVKTTGFGSGFSQVITDFEVLDKVADGTFAEPK